MFKRLANSGINLAVIIIAVVIFLLAFFALNGLAAAQKPPTLTVLAASRDLQIGEVITGADLVEKTVYKDDNAALYIPVEQAGEVVGGVVALPLRAGQPVFRDMVIALAGESYRLSAALNQYPDHSLFPLPLDANNVIAPKATSFLPGDLIGVTVVLGARPQPPATPTPNAYAFMPTPVITATLPVSLFETESEEAEAQARAYPPLAKDLFPQGSLGDRCPRNSPNNDNRRGSWRCEQPTGFCRGATTGATDLVGSKPSSRTVSAGNAAGRPGYCLSISIQRWR